MNAVIKTIFIFDPVTSGFSHAVFNYTILKSVINIPSISVVYLLLDGDQVSLPLFQKISFHPKITFCSFHDIIMHKKVVRNLVAKIKKHWQAFKIAKAYKPDAVLFLAGDNLFSPLIFWIIGLKYSKQIVVIFHNNIENYRSQKSKLKRALSRLLWSFALETKKGEVLVLSEFVKNQLNLMLPRTRASVLPLPTYEEAHSYSIKVKGKQEKCIDFLFLGSHAYRAFVTGFLGRFIFEISNTWKGHKVPVVALPGSFHLESEQASVSLKYLEDYPETNRYLDLIRRSRFVVIPSVSGSRISASSVMADTMTLGVPLVAPMAGFFAEHAASQMKKFYYDDDQELTDVLQNIKKLKEDEYLSICQNIVAYSQKFSIDNVSKRMQKIFGYS